MTDTMNSTWELSAAHETYYAERKAHVAELLHTWGSTTNSQWPHMGRFISINEVQMTPAWFVQIVMIGKAGIAKTIPGWRLAQLFPQRTWGEHSHDAYFMEITNGNVNKDSRAAHLMAYIVGVDYVRVVELGCHHPHYVTSRVSGSWSEYRCESCDYKWGVDSSD
jgi:hypothetical protein